MDAPLLFGSVAPGQLRDQQFIEAEKDSRREHDDREDHAADQSECRQWGRHFGAESQPLGDHEIFRRVDAGPEVIRHRKRQCGLYEPMAHRDGVACGGMFSQSEDQ